MSSWTFNKDPKLEGVLPGRGAWAVPRTAALPHAGRKEGRAGGRAINITGREFEL